MIRFRPGTFETNSSSSHTIVLGGSYNSHEIASSGKDCYLFNIKAYGFGQREKNIHADISRKFSFFFQAFIGGLEFTNEGEELFVPKETVNEYGQESYTHVKHPNYRKNRKKILTKFNRLMELLHISSDKIREMYNIRLDFSDMELSLTGDYYPLIVYKSNPLASSANLSNTVMEKFCMKHLMDELEKMLNAKKKEYEERKTNFYLLTEFLVHLLDFAFSTSCCVIEHDDSSTFANDEELNETISHYFYKNEKECEIISGGG